MRFTYSWLCEFITLTLNLEQLVAKLNKIGFEVEAVVDRTAELKPFVIAEITHAEPHPDASRLKLCRVHDGSVEHSIVCGGSNARSGIKVVLAPIGAIIPSNQLKIKASTIRGVASNGMLCSGDELGLDGYFNCPESGIIELDSSAQVGANFAEYYQLNDPVIDIDVTPNRGDALSVYGIARDLAASDAGILKPLPKPSLAPLNPQQLDIKLQHPDCSNYTGALIQDTNNQTPTPWWLKRRLLSCGHNLQSLLVDISNYVMLSYGQPLHFYDATKISDITVASAKSEENFTSLEGKDYQLTPDILTIRSNNQPVAVAGVMGGAASACTNDTTSTFIEAATFRPQAVVTSGRQLKLHSEARHRFERATDPQLPTLATQIAVAMVSELAGGKMVAANIIANDDVITPSTITFKPEHFTQLLGMTLPTASMVTMLQGLGCEVKITADTLMVTPPSWRHDLTMSEDLIEELVRLHGYDQLSSTPLPPAKTNSLKPLPSSSKRPWQAVKKLASLGLTEVITWSMTALSDFELFSDSDPITLKNPINPDLAVMRPSILTNLLKMASTNKRHQQTDYHVFEVGPIFDRQLPDLQQDAVAVLRLGKVGPVHFTNQEAACYSTVKADLLQLVPTLGLKPSSLKFKPHQSNQSLFHPNKAADVYIGNKLIAVIGELHPKLLNHYQLTSPAAAVELYLDQLPPAKDNFYRGNFINHKVPPVARDFAFVMPKDLNAATIIDAIAKADRKLIADIAIFDIYEGDRIASNQKSLALTVKLQAAHTLSESDIEACSSKIIDAAAKVGGTLRQ